MAASEETAPKVPKGAAPAEGKLRPWAPGEERVNRLVFIGRNLDRKELTAGITSCIAE